ncbi:hypothetical protein ACFWM3_23200 [Gottfriedia sp. NPDC058432]|uniref:hypothetical protein n=1 Tax=Gottfriedia sp. NPDC058432 TaxID=3346497 RepID=UPI003665397F
MKGQIKVEFLSKKLTLGNVEEIINELFTEIQSAYEPEQLTAKIIIRVKKEKDKVMYL